MGKFISVNKREDKKCIYLRRSSRFHSSQMRSNNVNDLRSKHSKLVFSINNATSFLGSVVFPQEGVVDHSLLWEDERPWERGCKLCSYGAFTIGSLRTYGGCCSENYDAPCVSKIIYEPVFISCTNTWTIFSLGINFAYHDLNISFPPWFKPQY